MGNAGDFYIDTSTSTMYGPKAASVYGADESPLGGTPTNTLAGGYATASRFKFLVDGRIIALKFYRSSASTQTSRTLKLWKPDGTLVASAVTAGETGQQWITATLATPYVVTANDELHVGYDEPASLMYSGPRTSLVPAHVTILGSAYGGLGSFPTNFDPGTMYGYGDVVFDPATQAIWPIAMQPVSGVPAGGTTGQQLTKVSGTDFDTTWTTDPQQLTGTGAPAASTGNVGDFYIDTSTSTMYGPKVGVSFGSPESVLGSGAPPNIGSGPYMEGNRLRVLVAGQIAQLRYYAVSAGVARKVTLWRNSDQAKLSEVSHTAGAVGWQTATLATPVLVAANTDLTVSVDPTNDIYGPIAPSLSANITWLSGAYGTTGGSYPASNDPNDMYWVDIVFQAGTTPWPIAMQPGGAPTLAYRHVQSSAATTWSITHNLSFRPNVAAVDSTGREIWPGATDYTSATTVQLTFSAAVGGEAYLS